MCRRRPHRRRSTGSGREARAGGWGWLVGDDGSGAWLTREASREVLRRSDAGEQLGKLGEAMLGVTRARHATDLMGRLHRLNEPGEWAALAGVVFESAGGDPRDASPLWRAAFALGGPVGSVGEKVSLRGARGVWGGELPNQPPLGTGLRPRPG